MKAFFSVLTLAVLFIALAFIPSSAQSSTIVVADFDSRQSRTNAGGQFGTWDKDPNDRSQSCVMTFAADDALAKKGGASVRLAYDVDSSSPAYNGFWLKLDGVKTDGYDALTFYIRGDAETGFTSRIKVEIKDKKERIRARSMAFRIGGKRSRYPCEQKKARSTSSPLFLTTSIADQNKEPS